MPERKGTRRIDSNEVQGADSWIEIRPLRVAELRALFTSTQDVSDTLSTLDITAAQFAEVVSEWNWVDEDGQALPQPHHNPAVFDQLTNEEWYWIGNVFKQMVNPSTGIAEKKD